jgi:hypothetical protein
MRDNSQETFRLSGSSRSRSQGRTQTAFMLREGALRMPTSAVKLCREAIVHSASIDGLRPGTPVAPVVDRNDDRTDAQFFAADPMMPLGVVGRVAHQAMNRRVTNSLHDGRQKVGRVVAGTTPHPRGGDQMTGMMGDGGQLGITPIAFHSAGAGQKMTTDVVTFQARRIDRGLRSLLDQAAFVGNTENRRKESVKSPFLRSRSWAF